MIFNTTTFLLLLISVVLISASGLTERTAAERRALRKASGGVLQVAGRETAVDSDESEGEIYLSKKETKMLINLLDVFYTEVGKSFKCNSHS